jgi:glycine cleavage system regulatory protein
VQRALVLTVIGRDRPGLVERLAHLIAQSEGNWLESRMSRLGGEFAGILRITVPDPHAAPLRAALEALAAEGLTVTFRSDDPSPSPPTRLVQLELVGQDRPGIVRQLATTLAALGVNVEELTTDCRSAPMSGEPLFQAQARLALPDTLDLERLRAELQQVANDLLVEVDLEPVLQPPA